MIRYGRMKTVTITTEPMIMAILFGGLFTPVLRTRPVSGVVSNGGGAMVVVISTLLRGLHDDEVDRDDHQAHQEIHHGQGRGDARSEGGLVLEDQRGGGVRAVAGE